jgi:alpha-tubulin suppressor-like RCC1 family protein
MKIKIVVGLLIILIVLIGVFYFKLWPVNQGSTSQTIESRIFTGPTSFHTFEIRDGELWGWGKNDHGQIGDGSRVNRTRPIKIGSSKKWVSASTGAHHSLGLKTDGTLWAWGKLNIKEFEDDEIVITPLQIGEEKDWKIISAGRRHNLALKSDGSLWAWGSNENGQLGAENEVSSDKPIKIGNEKWIFIASGDDYSLAIKSDSTLWVWGYNNFGQLGTGDTLSKKIPTQVGNDKNWKSVSISNYSQSGFFRFEASSYGLKSDGSLWAWGSNDRGQLGIGIRKQRQPMKIESKLKWQMFDGGFGIKSDGSLWTWGPKPNYPNSKDKTHFNPIQIGNDKNWKSIFIGYNQNFATKTDGSLWCWGENWDGQLGIGCFLNKENPTLIKRDAEWLHISGYYDHCLGIKSDGSLWAWGSNNKGELGIVGTESHTSPVKVGTELNWVTVSAGAEHSLGIKSDGSLWEWGSEGSDSYRDVPFQIGCDNNWERIKSGFLFNIAGRNDGSLWGWGSTPVPGISYEYSEDYKIPGLVFSDKIFSNFALDEDSWFAINEDGEICVFGEIPYNEFDEGSLKWKSNPGWKEIALFDG